MLPEQEVASSLADPATPPESAVASAVSPSGQTPPESAASVLPTAAVRAVVKDMGDHFHDGTKERRFLRVMDQVSVRLAVGKLVANQDAGKMPAELRSSGPTFRLLQHKKRHDIYGVVPTPSSSAVGGKPDGPMAVETLAFAREAAKKIGAIVDPVYVDPDTGFRLAYSGRLTVCLKDAESANDSFPGSAAFKKLTGTKDQFIVAYAALTAEEAMAKAEALVASGRARWAEPDFFTETKMMAAPAETEFQAYANQWHLHNTGAGQSGGTAGADIHAEGAWDITTGDDTVRIAVIDQAFQMDHPDLVDQWAVNAGETNTSDGIDDDADGYIDNWRGWDFSEWDGITNFGDNEPTFGWTNEIHGTFMAGIAGASWDHGRGTGVAPGCRIVPIRLSDDDYAPGDTSFDITQSQYAQAIRYAGDHAEVLSMSLGFASSTSTTSAIDDVTANGRQGLGLIVVAASGNSRFLDDQLAPSAIQAAAGTSRVATVTMTADSGMGPFFPRTAYIDQIRIVVLNLSGVVSSVIRDEGFEGASLPSGVTISGGAVLTTDRRESVHGQRSIRLSSGSQAASVSISYTVPTLGASDYVGVRVTYRSTSSLSTNDFGTLGATASDVEFPARGTNAAGDRVIAVGATDEFDQLAAYSENGARLDLVAPGGTIHLGVVGTDAEVAATFFDPAIDGYAAAAEFTAMGDHISGTSAAAPQVAGVAALILSQNSGLTRTAVSDILSFCCDKVDVPFGAYSGGIAGAGGRNNVYGYGRLNAARAVRLAQVPAAPTLSASSASAGASITASGGPFRHISSVTVGGVAATFTQANAEQVSFTVPSSLVFGSRPVVITADNGSVSVPFDVLAAEVVVEQPVGSNINSGGSRSFGNAAVGSAPGPTLTFTIKNTGNSNLTGLTLSKISGVNDFSVATSPSAPVVPAGSTTFVMTFSPQAVGSRSAIWRIANNDPDESFFDIVLSGTGQAAEIAVEQPAGTNLVGGTSSRDFGTVLSGATSTLEFTVKNLGTIDLTGLNTTITGTQASDFSISVSPPASAAPGSSATFIVAFSPSGAGNRTATLHIANNDPDENPFDITLTGVGAAPEIGVEQPSGVNLNTNDSRDFGAVLQGNSSSLAFAIKNVGTADLSLGGMTRTGTHAGEFSVSAPSLATVPPSGVSTFTVTFAPGGIGTRSGVLHIPSNDADEGVFDIVLTGVGQGPDIQLSSTSLAYAAAAVSTTATVNQTLTITNTATGTGATSLTGLTAALSGPSASEFSVGAFGATTLAPGGGTTLVVTFKRRNGGAHTATLSIGSNDPDENPVLIQLSGTNNGAEIAVFDGTNELTSNTGTVSFGALTLDPPNYSRIFTIKNMGSTGTSLTISSVTSSNSTVFAVDTTGIASPLAAGNQTTFMVNFQPTAGTETTSTAIISVANTDVNENPFKINVSASVAPGGYTIRFTDNLTPGYESPIFNPLSTQPLTVVIEPPFRPLAGATLTAVSNTGAAAMTGRFQNLPNAAGDTITAQMGSETVYLKASYSGGDGNDLVLTRVPAPGQVTTYPWTTVAGKSGGAGTVDGFGTEARLYGAYTGDADLFTMAPGGYLLVAETGKQWDATGNVLVKARSCIREISPSGAVRTRFEDVSANSSSASTYVGTAMAADTLGNIYFITGNAIKKVGPTGTVTNPWAGSLLSGSVDGLGTIARFNGPKGITTDSTGNVYVADKGNHTIRKITPGGNVTTIAGVAGQAADTDGTGNYSGTGVARFSSPQAICFAPNGMLYVAQSPVSLIVPPYGNQRRIRKLDPSGGVVATLATYSTQSYSSSSPNGLAVDGSEHWYVLTGNQDIECGVGATAVTSAGAGDWAYQSIDGPSISGSASPARFQGPGALLVDATGTVFVFDRGYGPGSCIRKMTADPARTVTTFVGQPSRRGIADGFGTASSFCFPSRLKLRQDGAVLLTEDRSDSIDWNFRIRTLKPNGAAVDTSTLFLYDQWGFMDAIAVLKTGAGGSLDTEYDYYYTDSPANAGGNAVRKYSWSGTSWTHALFAGASTGASGYANATGGSARFSNPGGLVYDPKTASLYVADCWNNAIRRIVVSSKAVTTAAGGGPNAPGTADGTSTSARFSLPWQIVRSGQGKMYVLDAGNHKIRVMTWNGTAWVVSTLPLSLPPDAGSLSIDGSGAIYVTSGDSMESIDAGFVWKVAADGASYELIGGDQTVYDGCGGVGTMAHFTSPVGVVASGTGALYVTDVRDNRVARCLPSFAPQLSSSSPPVVSQNTFGMTATLNSNGYASSVTMEYGLTRAYGMVAPAGISGSAVSVSISGLSAGTIYYYRILATNVEGTSEYVGAFETLYP